MDLTGGRGTLRQVESLPWPPPIAARGAGLCLGAGTLLAAFPFAQRCRRHRHCSVDFERAGPALQPAGEEGACPASEAQNNKRGTMEPPPLHPKYQTPPKPGRAPSSAAGAAPTSTGLRREAADAPSSSSALARSAAGGRLPRSVAKGCLDPPLLPAGILSSGNHAGARAVVVQRGCAWGKDFTSCPHFLGQQNVLRSQPGGLGRFVKASMFPTRQAVARQRTRLFGTRVVPSAEGYSARAGSPGMDLGPAGTPTPRVLSPGPGAASRYFHTWLQLSCAAGATHLQSWG